MKYNNQAFTLIELIFMIAIASILLGIALPSFNDFIDKRKVDANLTSLAQTLQLSRTTAVTINERVTLCPVNQSLNCSSDWSTGYISFIDRDGNRNFDNEDTLLYQNFIKDPKVRISWRAFGHRRSLQYRETGITNHQNGSFELCYADDQKKHRALFITKAGRLRYSKDTNGDGYHENSRGGAITC